jgi:aryl-alcohol dehydrogenase-like predicted oxidoreductase
MGAVVFFKILAASTFYAIGVVALNYLPSLALESGATTKTAALVVLRRSPNILLIPGTSQVKHLRENLAAVYLEIGPDVLRKLERIGSNHGPDRDRREAENMTC